MHGKHVITCFKYQGLLYLHNKKTMTYLKSILVLLQSQHFLKCSANKTAHIPRYRQPSPALYRSITFYIWKKTLGYS
jgi:hypothetical protein